MVFVTDVSYRELCPVGRFVFWSRNLGGGGIDC